MCGFFQQKMSNNQAHPQSRIQRLLEIERQKRELSNAQLGMFL